MAQDIAAEMRAPRAWIVYAWVDATLHPKFATFQRWFPLMKAPWRRISLAVSLILILLRIYADGALDVYHSHHDAGALSPDQMLAYFTSVRGLFRAFFYGPCSLVTLFAMPAAVALVNPRSLGPYVIRFKRIFRPWVQVQPTICALLLFSTVMRLLLDVTGLSDIHMTNAVTVILSIFFSFLSLFLVPIPALATWSYSYIALAAGSSLSRTKAGLAAAIVGIFVSVVFWTLLAHILSMQGYPVL